MPTASRWKYGDGGLMPALSTWVSYITIFGVILAVVALTKNKVQNWATRRAVLQLEFWAWQHIPVSPANSVTRTTRVRLKLQQLCHNATLRLVPIQYRASLYSLQRKVDEELKTNNAAGGYFPSPDSNPLYVEIAAYIAHKERKARDKDLLRRHRGVRCAGGCGTKYGKKRKDHDFAGGGGVKGSGGWFCEWIGPHGLTGSCIPVSTGAHYCGMCHPKRAGRNQTQDME